MDAFEDFICHAKLSTLPLQVSQAPTAPMKQQLGTGQVTASYGSNALALDRHPVSQTAAQPGTAMRKLLLIEDMPHYTDLHQRQRLANLLGELMDTGCSDDMHVQHAKYCMHSMLWKITAVNSCSITS